MAFQPDRDPTMGPLLDALNVQGQDLNPAESSYYLNITGFLHGKSQFYNLSTPEALNDTLPWKSLAESYAEGLNITRAGEMWGEWNWNASTKASLSVVEKKPLGMDEKPLSESDLALVHVRPDTLKWIMSGYMNHCTGSHRAQRPRVR